MNENNDSAGYRVAVLIPCFNEEKAIGKVVGDFRKALPDAGIYVYNNRSTDRTVEIATAAGAIVRDETHPGKGNVVRRMFADIEADIYVLVDGDDTYHAPSAPAMVRKLIAERLDMVVGTRLSDYSANAFRPGHRFGNDLLTGFLGMLFGRNCTDILSGYRVFSRRFVKSFPAVSKGFETESELTVHALELRMPIGEMTTPYQTRPRGLGQQTQDLSGRHAYPAHDPRHVQGRTAPDVFFPCIWISVRVIAGTGISGSDYLFANRSGAPLSDGHSFNRNHDSGISQPDLRIYSGHGNTRKTGAETIDLSVYSSHRGIGSRANKQKMI